MIHGSTSTSTSTSSHVRQWWAPDGRGESFHHCTPSAGQTQKTKFVPGPYDPTMRRMRDQEQTSHFQSMNDSVEPTLLLRYQVGKCQFSGIMPCLTMPYHTIPYHAPTSTLPLPVWNDSYYHYHFISIQFISILLFTVCFHSVEYSRYKVTKRNDDFIPHIPSCRKQQQLRRQ